MTTLHITKRYGELEAMFLAWIKQHCTNIDNIDNIDESLKVDFEGKLKLYGTGTEDCNPGSTVGFRINNNTAVTAISLSEVTSLFHQFMSERNVEVKADKVLSTNGILNFWNNVAAFCHKYLVFAKFKFFRINNI